MMSSGASPLDDSEQSGGRLRVLRHIDQAASKAFAGGMDEKLIQLLTEASSVSHGTMRIVEAGVGSRVIWEPTEAGNRDEADQISFPIGLNGEFLALEYTQNPRRRPWQRDSHDFRRTVARQFENLFESYFERTRARWLDRLESDFFELDLHPTLCLDRLTAMLPSVFPSITILNQPADQVVQLLLVPEHDDTTLQIAASTGDEAGSIVKLDDSVVGLVFPREGMSEAPYVLGNPNDDPLQKLYKAFASGIQSELVLPLTRADGRTIGALNFESPTVNAYGKRELSYLTGLTPRLTQMVDALRRQIISDEHSRLGLVATQSNYWETVGRILRHDLRNPTAAIGMSLQEIENLATDIDRHMESPAFDPSLIVKTSQEIHRRASLTRSKVKQQLTLLNEFGRRFTDYLKFEYLDVDELLDDSVRVARERLGDAETLTKVNIYVENLTGIERPTVFGSPLLKVFIYNVLENSIFWIRSADPGPDSLDGKINVTIAELGDRGPVPRLNRHLRISIVDSGPGASPEIVERINDSLPRKISARADGEGYALQAFREYVRGIGGSVRVSSQIGSGFRVDIDLRTLGRRDQHD